jgi:ABC-2 type transport system permease protein
MSSRLIAIWVVARREIVTRGRSKAFRISTGLLLLGLILGIAIPATLMRSTTHFTVAVVNDPGTEIRHAITVQAVSAGITVTSRPAASRSAAAGLVENGAASAAVIGTRELIWKNTENARLAQVLTSAVTQSVLSIRARDLGLTPAQLGGLLAAARPEVTRLHPKPDRGPQQIIALIGIILLFVAINFYGSYVLTGVVEEKTSRVVEVLLSRVRPADLLAGKVAGIGALGISQFAGLAIAAAAALAITRPPDLPAGTIPFIGSVVIWFIVGYSFYSLLYGALGALASRTEDAQAAAAPLTVFLMLAYFGAFATIASPQAWWVTAGSLFPPTAPIFMPLRTALTNVPAWQIATALALTIVAIIALVRIGGRIYRGAVLHTSGRLSLRQAWHIG